MYEYFKTDLGILYCGDVLDILFDEFIDLVIADPPYNSTSFLWDYKDDEWQFKWLEQVKRVMKEGASLYVFFAPLNMYGVEGWVRKNLNLKNIMVWFHPNLYSAGLSYGDDRWKCTWDVIFYAVKGEKAKHNKVVSVEGWKLNPHGGGFDVKVFSQPRPLLHEAQKPLELIEMLVHCSSNENDLVLDLFSGSGTTALVCEKLKRKWIAIEKEEVFCEIIVKRLKEFQKVGSLF
jgi:site-specific DNA-methyltransferase (adenine-specific)